MLDHVPARRPVARLEALAMERHHGNADLILQLAGGSVDVVADDAGGAGRRDEDDARAMAHVGLTNGCCEPLDPAEHHVPFAQVGADRLRVLGLPAAPRGEVARIARGERLARGAADRRMLDDHRILDDRGVGDRDLFGAHRRLRIGRREFAQPAPAGAAIAAASVCEGGISGKFQRPALPLRDRAEALFAGLGLRRAKVDGHRRLISLIAMARRLGSVSRNRIKTIDFMFLWIHNVKPFRGRSPRRPRAHPVQFWRSARAGARRPPWSDRSRLSPANRALNAFSLHRRTRRRGPWRSLDEARLHGAARPRVRRDVATRTQITLTALCRSLTDGRCVRLALLALAFVVRRDCVFRDDAFADAPCRRLPIVNASIADGPPPRLQVGGDRLV